MPSKSIKQATHLAKLRQLPQVVAHQFKPGPRDHLRTRLPTVCFNCETVIEKTPSQISRATRHFCSKSCADAGKLSPIKDEIIRLYQEKKKLKEICEVTGKRMGTVAAMIHRWRLAQRHGNPTSARGIVKKLRPLLPSSCQLCGYSRVVELAHIIPAYCGGRIEIKNILSLCPNCHHLFDHGLLSLKEQEYILEVCRALGKQTPKGLYGSRFAQAS